MKKARLESFSDGVFAFAITLLVLGIQFPELRGGGDLELRHALIHSLSQLVPYVTSFATIGRLLNHLQMSLLWNQVKRSEDELYRERSHGHGA
jgi:uncharacterized membrane protein